MLEYVTQLREGILEAYTGIVTGLKKTEKGSSSSYARSHLLGFTLLPVNILLPHIRHILDLVRRCLAEEDRADSSVRLSFGLLGDVADSFPNGQIKQILLESWVVSELRSKHRMAAETKKTMRWAREVCYIYSSFTARFTDALFKMVRGATA